MTAEPSLSSLVGSRICHDLVSPLGAIGNGVELIVMSGALDSSELSLLAESVEHASARLRYFRIAFGPSGQATPMSAEECRAILGGYFARSRIAAAWHPEEAVSREAARLALLFVLCAESALPRGGTIDVTRSGEHWQVVACGSRPRLAPELWDSLRQARPPEGISAGQVHFALAAAAMAESRRTPGIAVTEDRLAISF